MPPQPPRLPDPPDPPTVRYRFGPFDLDVRAGELRKHGIRLRFGQQTLQILLMLLKRPGEVVLREDIRTTLWPDNTVVEFDHSINAAIQRLRDALGDSAEEPRYIETLTRRGYRFLAQVVAETPIATPPLPVPASPPPLTRLRSKWVVLLAGLAVCAVALAGLGWIPKGTAERKFTLSLGAIGEPVLSPDGSAALYRGSLGLFLRRMDSLAETSLYPSTLNDRPAWSPDGTQIVFLSSEGLIRIRLPHGAREPVWPEARVTRGYSVGDNGNILVAVSRGGQVGLYLVSPGSGAPLRVEVPGFSHGSFYEPELLPGSEDFLFTWSSPGEDQAGIYLARMKHGRVVREPILLRRNITAGHFAPSAGGRLLFVQEDNLFAQKLDVAGGKLVGDPQPIAQGVMSNRTFRRALFSTSRNGMLGWRSGKAALAQLTWFDRHGQSLETAGPAFEASDLRLSPDEKHVLISIGSTVAGVLDSHRDALVRLPGTSSSVWMPDSLNVVYGRKPTGQLLQRNLASGIEREIGKVPAVGSVRAVSSDGKVLLYTLDQRVYSYQLGAPPNPAPPQPILDGTVQIGFSPDSRWIVYARRTPASNRPTIFVQPFAFSGLPTPISDEGGRGAVWRGDGKEILYLNGNKIFAVPVEIKGNELRAGERKPLFEVRPPIGLTGDSQPLAVTRDGSRILFAQAVESTESRTAYVMTAWDRALKP